MKSDPLLSSDSTVPSSPTSAIFSENVPSSEPPSSPPGFPWEQTAASQDMYQPALKPKVSAFSLLGKRKALTSIDENAPPIKKAALAPPKSGGKTLTQMQISLGQETQKRCTVCGMEYVPSSVEDRKLHDKYHEQNTQGYDVGKDFVQKARLDTVFPGVRRDDKICAIDFHDRPARRRRAQAVLEVVQRELGAVEIPETDIWNLANSKLKIDPLYVAYLYLRGSKCVAFLLVKKIKAAHKVVEPAKSAKQNANRKASGALAALQARKKTVEEATNVPIELSEQTYDARLGISRIWTSSSLRNQNIASALLDAAYNNFQQCYERDRRYRIKQQQTDDRWRNLPEWLRETLDQLMPPLKGIESKEMVAFSQPTDAGARLARKWFGRTWGWAVYVE